MKIALHDHDSKIPNLALMKLSAWHKSQGDEVEFYSPFFSQSYATIYSSKIFSWTEYDPFLIGENIVYGGSGNDLLGYLPDEIEHICPDYELYDWRLFEKYPFSMGFLTRGCHRNCEFCIVPQKEGKPKVHSKPEEFIRHKHVSLMDNNILSSDSGVKALESLYNFDVRVDFNQGIDARLIDDQNAKRLAKLKWWKPIRMACDDIKQLPTVIKATERLRNAGATPKAYSSYVLVEEIPTALERVMKLKEIGVDPFAMAYRSLDGTEPSKEIKKFARWVNHKAIFKTVKWEDYKK